MSTFTTLFLRAALIHKPFTNDITAHFCEGKVNLLFTTLYLAFATIFRPCESKIGSRNVTVSKPKLFHLFIVNEQPIFKFLISLFGFSKSTLYIA